MDIELNIEEGKKLFHYTTKEFIKKCPNCGREYKSRKYCLDCYKKRHRKIETIDTIKTHEGWITKDLKKYSCDCIFGSFFRWGKKWQENHPKSRCKHVKNIMSKINNEKDN